MDFDAAAQRLATDQRSAAARSRASRNARSAGAKARREAQAARAKAEKRLREKKLEGERSAKIVDEIVKGVGRVERELGVANVGAKQSTAVAEGGDEQQQLFAGNHPLACGWTFTATSIHGEGDKIALPPSVLETMTSSANDLDPWGSGRNGRPVAFRIAILNPAYSFPAGEKMQALVESVRNNIMASEKKELTQQDSTMTDDSTNAAAMDEDGSDDESDDSYVEAYLAELSHRYLAFTHGTVVEFTQEEGCVGLPEPIARALLQSNSHSLGGRKKDIPVKRTVDPAKSAAKDTSDGLGEAEKDTDTDEMNADAPNDIPPTGADDGGEKTPGHPAYGLFDVPDLPIEITPVNSLPPGKNCTFTPTASSIKNGFYTLKDVKAVLEQSLMRTRATLSKGDVIHTWRRGVSFDLIVSSLTPTKYGAVSCINTNLNVDIGPPEGEEGEPATETAVGDAKAEPNALAGGRLLSEPSSRAEPKQSAPVTATATAKTIDLPTEPPEDAREGVCNVQIRGRTPSGASATGRRRFDVTNATVADLFAFASHVCEGVDPSGFRLATTFPRRVFQLSSNGEDGGLDPNATLDSAGIGQGQENFMIEML
ncbi:hypothetical protein ACHAXT_007872 [Thalassiosira profunda]